ncbi:MAG: helix-turn-helix domain-containing protein [Methyloprofundus sp.]|nr:helix-turn-helix domain-containing protein [Methyloprofundus sp.]
MSPLPTDQQNTHHAPPALMINTGQIEVSEPTEFEAISQPWEVMVTRLDKKPFNHQKTYLITPSVMLYTESFSSAIHLHGLTPDGMLGFSIPIKLGKQSLYWNSPFNPHELPASVPGGLDVVLDAGQTHIVVLIEISLLERMLTHQQVTALKNAASRRQLPIERHALDCFTQWLLNLLNHAQQHADIFTRTKALHSVEEDLLQQLLSVVRLPLAMSIKDSRQKRRQGFELALEFLREADLSSLSIPEICRKTGVSQRTLEYAFHEHLNLTPIRFIKKIRMHAIRRKLLVAHSNEVTIADTAYQHGIYDMSRFAAVYRNFFGELPSKTLHNHPIDSIKPFMAFK